MSKTTPKVIALNKSIVDRIESSETFKEYASAFQQATGLPLEITEANNVKFALCSKSHGNNNFCKLMSNSGYNCDTCRALNRQIAETFDECGIETLKKHSQVDIGYTSKTPQTVSSIRESFWEKGPKTFECFAGMCESLVPIRSKNRLIGFLKTGQVLLNKPTKNAFRNAFEEITKIEPTQNKIDLEKYYFETPVLPPQQYEAMVLLLKTFSVQLSALADQISIQIDHEEPLIVQKAKKVMQERYCEPLVVDEIARSVAISPFHLSRTFKDTTGKTILEYLNFIRIEKAKKLLIQNDISIAEIAFQVGFGSLAPFNKAFKKFNNLTPKQFRLEHAHA